MFTIRHKDSDGQELLAVAKRLFRTTAPPAPPDCGCAPGAVGKCQIEPCPRKTSERAVTAEMLDGTNRDFRTGVLFVMNEQGRTVATYEWHHQS